MLRMCNKGLFAGVGLSGLKLHCFYDILRLHVFIGLDHLAIATMSDVQTGFKIRLQCMLENILHANNIGSFQKRSTEEISAVRRGRGDKIVSDNSKCIRTSEGGRGVNFQFPLWGWYGCFLE